MKQPAVGWPWKREVAWVSGTDVNDYMKLALWADAVKSVPGTDTTAFIPYLPAARADRGNPFGAGIYAKLIGMANLDTIACFDPHSPVMVQELGKYVEHVGVLNLDYFTVKQTFAGYDGIIAPDKGAVDRATRIANILGLPVYEAGKTRDFENGELTGFTCPTLPPGRYLIVDDICDGGGTFNGLADFIGEQFFGRAVKLDLYVSHGIFSKGLITLGMRFDKIYTTNSLTNPGDVVSRYSHKLRIIDIKSTMIGL